MNSPKREPRFQLQDRQSTFTRINSLLVKHSFASASCFAIVLWIFCCSARGQVVELPTMGDRIWLEIQRSAHTVTLFRGAARIKSYPVAIGRPGWETPTGTFHILQMQKNPSWRHPLTGEIFRAGDAGNELGHYWIGFSGTKQGEIGLHDTPHPETVGKSVSHGCVRMFENDIAELFRQVHIGTFVTVVP